jgi:hypothetical protein
MVKIFLTLILLIPGALYAQGYILSFKLFTPDGFIVADTSSDYKVNVKFAETIYDESINVKFDNSFKDWDFYYSENYAGGTYIINVVRASKDTMNIIFNTKESKKVREYYGNLFIDEIQFKTGTYYIGYPKSLSDWNSLIARDFFPVHFGRFYDITDFQPWVENNSFNIIQRDSLVGVWQDNNVVGSGWSNTYLFFNNGTYKFFYSQMDCAKRIVSHAGKWSIAGEVLSMEREEQRVIVGGQMILAQGGSCASDSILINGREKIISFSRPKISNVAVSRIYIDTAEDEYRPRMYIDAVPFWKFIDNPSDIIREFEYR